MIVLSLLVCLVGLVVYLLANPANAKLLAISINMFWVGLLVFLLSSDRVITLLHPGRW